MKKSLCFILLFISIVGVSQDFYIKEITVEGNKKTQRSFLDKILESKVNQKLDSTELEDDLTHLRNLKYFSDSHYAIDFDGDSCTIHLSCDEVYTLLPLLNFGSVKGNQWYRVGVSDINLLGRGYRLNLYYQYNTKHSLIFDFQTPRLKALPLSFGLNTKLQNFYDPNIFHETPVLYAYHNKLLDVFLEYQFQFKHTLTIATGYSSEEYEPVDRSLEPTLSEFEFNRWFSQITYAKDRINNIRNIYSDGYRYEFMLEFAKNNLKNNILNQYSIGLFHYFRAKKRFNFAHRIYIKGTHDYDTPFASIVLDNYENIRGIGYRSNRSYFVTSLNSETRYTIYEGKKIAFQGVYFIDLAYAAPTATQKQTEFYYSGVGIRFNVPKIYNAILRVDFGINLESPSENGIVMGIGHHF